MTAVTVEGREKKRRERFEEEKLHWLMSDAISDFLPINMCSSSREYVCRWKEARRKECCDTHSLTHFLLKINEISRAFDDIILFSSPITIFSPSAQDKYTFNAQELSKMLTESVLLLLLLILTAVRLTWWLRNWKKKNDDGFEKENKGKRVRKQKKRAIQSVSHRRRVRHDNKRRRIDVSKADWVSTVACQVSTEKAGRCPQRISVSKG